MEKIILENDVPVMCVTAKSFPAGITEAFRELHTRISFPQQRRSFGLSRPEGGGDIVYKAAAEERTPGEAAQYELEQLHIPAGTYLSLEIRDYVKTLPAISQAFRELLKHPNIDPNGYCVEWYYNEKDVRCMVRIIEN